MDSGDGVSHSVPVFDGYCLPHSVQRFPLAGVDVTMHLKKVFTRYHLFFIFFIYRAEMLIAFGMFYLVKLVPVCAPLHRQLQYSKIRTEAGIVADNSLNSLPVPPSVVQLLFTTTAKSIIARLRKICSLI